MNRFSIGRERPQKIRHRSLGPEALEQRAMLSAYTLKLVDSLDLIPAYVESEIVRTASYGMNLISQYVDWKGTLNAEVRIRPASENPKPTANGLTPAIVSTTWTGSARSNNTLKEMITGVDPRPGDADVGTTIYLGRDGRIRNYGFLAWFDPEPSAYVAPKVPSGSFDFIGVFVHEVFHGMGFLGSSQEFQKLTTRIGSFDYFVGAKTQQVYGGPLPLAPRTGASVSDHYGNTSLPGNKLQSGLMFQWGNYQGNRWDIGRLDLAVLQDLGLKIKSTAGLPLVDEIDSRRPTTVLSNNIVNENLRTGTVVATLTRQGGPTTSRTSFSLVAGAGSNAFFRLSGNQVVTAGRLDYEQIASHSLFVRITDQNGVFTDTRVTISVRDVMEFASVTSLPSRFQGANNTCVISDLLIAGDKRPVILTLAAMGGQIYATSGTGVAVGGTTSARTFTGTPAALTEYFRGTRVLYKGGTQKLAIKLCDSGRCSLLERMIVIG